MEACSDCEAEYRGAVVCQVSLGLLVIDIVAVPAPLSE